MLINLFAQRSSVPKWTITLLPVSLLCLRVPLASSSGDPKFCVRMCRKRAHQQSASVSPISPDGTFEWLRSVFALAYFCLVPASLYLTQFSVLTQRASVKGHDPPRLLLTFENFLCANICQGPYLNHSLNPHSPPAFLLICPSTRL